MRVQPLESIDMKAILVASFSSGETDKSKKRREKEMSKRYIDTEIWNKRWFRMLRPKMKNAWFWITGKCNHAGFLADPDMDLASFQIGERIEEDEILRVFKDRIFPMEPDGSPDQCWFIPQYIEFQYGQLDPKNRVHKSVLNILQKKLDGDLGSYMTQTRVIDEAKDKDKEKDIAKAKDKDKERVKGKIISRKPKHEQVKEVREMVKSNPKQFSEKVDVWRAFQTWCDYMEQEQKTYKKYLPAFRNWVRKAEDFAGVAPGKTSHRDFMTDSTGFYIGYCEECGTGDSYDKAEVYGDSRCCKKRILPDKAPNG
jgi:hypothetical protein